MARHQGDSKDNKGSGRQGGFRKTSFTRGNAPIRKFAPKPVVTTLEPEEIRLNKYLSNAGLCTRKEADIYIQSGVVHVNGQPVTEMGFKVKKTDVVIFDGRVIQPGEKVYILLNKPKNFSTSTKNPHSEKNVFHLIKSATTAAVQPIGRMDAQTVGLLLFTNDQEMIEKFSRSHQTSPKIYQVSLEKALKPVDLEKISKGVQFDEHRLSVDEVSYIESEPHTEVGIKLRTANVGVVKSIFEKFGYKVIKVDRVSFAGLTKKNLPRGNWRVLTKQEIINLKNI